MRLNESPSASLSRHGKVLRGLFAECGVKNQNQRIYPAKVYLPALESVLPKIKEGRLLGELDHPSDYDEVRLSNVSHVIKECKVEGNKISGSVELLDTPAGKIAQALVEAGIPLGISSRGVGDTRRIREGDEVTDFTLITFDLVADPSFSNAVLSESVKVSLKSKLDEVARTLPMNESAGDSKSIKTKIESIKKGLDEAPSVTSKLVESMGALVDDKCKLEGVNKELKATLSETTKRNKSLATNMSRLQDSYNLMSESISSIEESNNKKLKEMKEVYKGKLNSMRESYESKIGGLNEEIVDLRKQLAIEKRGMDPSKIMPMLEGVTTTTDIENQLDYIKNLNARRKVSTTKEVVLTEGLTSRSKPSKLTKIVSSV